MWLCFLVLFMFYCVTLSKIAYALFFVNCVFLYRRLHVVIRAATSNFLGAIYLFDKNQTNELVGKYQR